MKAPKHGTLAPPHKEIVMNLENPALEPGMTAAPMLPPAAPVQGAVDQAVPPEIAARARRAAMARAKQEAKARAMRENIDSPEALVLYQRAQSLAPYARALKAAQVRFDRVGVLDRLRNPEAYEHARTRLELARSVFGKVEAAIDDRQTEMLQKARLLFESRSESPVPQVSPAGSVIEIDPRHQRAASMLAP
jgi:multidrug resistance efflux pump